MAQLLNEGRRYKYLTQDDIDHFLGHGWIKVPNAINPEYIEAWVGDVWDRTGYSPTDKSTWKYEYLHMPFHRQVRVEDFAPAAFEKISELCGGEENLDPERERWVGDNFVINFGSAERSAQPTEGSPKDKLGWHCDNDWFRQFLDSSGTALTVINCFTDIPDRGGGTWLCEDGLTGVLRYLYEHPEGLDPALTANHLMDHLKDECSNYVRMVARKGDVFILHGLLPHSTSWNYLHYPRIITNVHVTLREPLDLNRPGGNYTLVEQVILRGLGRESIPEFKPTRERKFWYPRNTPMKERQVEGELERLVKAAKARGQTEASVDSIWLKGQQAKDQFERVNGLLLPVNEASGLETDQHPI